MIHDVHSPTSSLYLRTGRRASLRLLIVAFSFTAINAAEIKSLVRGENFVVFGEAVADPRNGNVNQVWLRKDCLVNYMRR